MKNSYEKRLYLFNLYLAICAVTYGAILGVVCYRLYSGKGFNFLGDYLPLYIAALIVGGIFCARAFNKMNKELEDSPKSPRRVEKGTIDYFDKVSKQVSPRARRFVSTSLDIVDRVDSILKKKKMTRKDLAEAMELDSEYIHTRLTGLYNMDINFICRVEIALGERIIKAVK